MHPLRPKEGYIIVCEGNDDAVFLNSILSSYLIDHNLSVFYAGGSHSLKPMANVLQPSVYITDRDFNIDFAQAEASLQSEERFTAWKRFDIESYLVYSDWLFQVAEAANISPKLRIRNFPSSADVVSQQIHQIAESLVVDHAGRKTIALMTKRLGWSVDFQFRTVRSIVKSGAEVATQADWEKLLEQETDRIRDKVAEASVLTLQDVLDEFHQQIEFYDTAKDNIEFLQQEFSGKRIIQMLTKRWGLIGGRGRPWQIIQNRLIESAKVHANIHQGLLSDDQRLGDVGLLASKVLGTAI